MVEINESLLILKVSLLRSPPMLLPHISIRTSFVPNNFMMEFPIFVYILLSVMCRIVSIYLDDAVGYRAGKNEIFS
jgi:hypothetical protein